MMSATTNKRYGSYHYYLGFDHWLPPIWTRRIL